MKLINADAIIAALESFSDRAHGNQHFLNGIKTAKELIAEADEAVVRRGECKALMLKAEKPRYMCCKFNGLTDPKPNDYCSYGERREA